MRYLKRFENNVYKFDFGEDVILTEFDPVFLTPNFEVGERYKIFGIDNADQEHTYCIIDKNEVKGWVTTDQIRKLEPLEIDQDKFNL